MAIAETITCTVCGEENPETNTRCRSCGARIEKLVRELTQDEIHARRYQQDTFEWKWVVISFVLYMILGAIVFIALPMVITNYDPQGIAGLVIAGGIWFLGGIVVGILSPGKTYLEPPVGALLAVVPTLMYLDSIGDVYRLPSLAYMVGGMIGVMTTLMGSFIGERLQPGRKA